MIYADYNYYINEYGGDLLNADNAYKALQRASETVDSLTYCRIASEGLPALTPHQKNIVQRVTCAIADFQFEHSDMIDNPYKSYSINGVSATWGDAVGVMCVAGVQIPRRIYSDLSKTGLCHQGVW